MPINVPNPYGVDVAISPAGGRSVGLQAAPETRNNKQRLFADLAEHGKEFVKKLEEWQGQIDVTRSKDLINQLEESRIDLRTNPETGYMKLEGENALARPSGKSLHDEVSESFKSTYDRIRAKASTPRQRQILDDYYQAASQKLGQDVDSWVVRQQDVYEKAVEDQTLRTAARKAMSDDPDEQRDGEFVIRSMLAEKAKREGVPQDSARYLWPIHLNRVAGMADGYDVDGANAYLERYKEEMTPAGYERAKSMIGRAKDQRDIEAATNSIVASYGSEREAMEAVKQYPRAIRDRVRSNLREHFSVLDRERRLQAKEAKEAAWNYVRTEGKLPPASLLEDVDESAIRSMEGYLDRKGRAAQREKEKLERLRKKDPVGASIQEGDFGYTAITDWTKPTIVDELGKRASNYEDMRESYGSKAPTILSSDEVASLKDILGALDPKGKMDLVGSIVHSLDDDGAVSAFADQMGDEYRNFVLISSDDDMRAAGVPRLYAKGRQGLAEDQSQLKDLKNNTVGINAQWQKLNGLYDDPRVRSAVMDTVLNVSAGLAIEAGQYASGAQIDEAMKMVVGEIHDYQGRKVALRDGLDMSDFEASVQRTRTSLSNLEREKFRTPAGRELSGPELSAYLATAPLVPAVSGNANAFNISCMSGLILDSSGAPFEIQIYEE